MGLIQRLKQFVSREGEPLPKEVSQFVTVTLPNTTPQPPLAAPDDLAKLVAECTGWAYACAQKTANTVAQVPLRLYRGVPRNAIGKGVREAVEVRKLDKHVKDRMFNNASLFRSLNKAVDIEEVLVHPWYELLREANRNLGGFELMQLTVLFKQVTGNCYWLVPKTPQGTPTELWTLPSQFVKIVPDPDKFVKMYRYGLGADHVDYEPEVITHFKYPSLKSIYYGSGPLEAAFLSQVLNEDFDEYEKAMLDNGAVMPAYFVPEVPLSPGAMGRLRKDIQRIHGGHKNAGKLGMLQQGLQLLPAAWSPKDINYAIGMKMTLEKIAGIFGVPLSKLKVDNVNRANADAGNYSYMKDTISPECVALSAQINQDIMPQYDEKLFVFFDDVVPEDEAFKLLQEESRLKTGVTYINEVREAEGLDALENADEPLVSNTLAPLSQITAEPEPMPIMGGLPIEENQPEQEDEKGHKCRCRHIKSVKKSPIYPSYFEAEVEEAAADWMLKMRLIVAPYISQFTVTSAVEVEAAIPWAAVTESGINIMTSPLGAVLKKGMKDGIVQASINMNFLMTNEQALEWAKNFTAQRVTASTVETRMAIRDIVSNRIATGLNPTALAKELRGVIGLNDRQMKANIKFGDELEAAGLSSKDAIAAKAEYTAKQIKQRAEMIARTETSMAYSEGTIAAYKQAGLDQVEFQPSGDACPDCLVLDGSVYPLNNSTGIIPVHPNCRCTWLPVL